MTNSIGIDTGINSRARCAGEVTVDVEILDGDTQEADNSNIGKKRMSNEKPPLPKKAKNCPPKGGPNSADGFGNRRRAEVWKHAIESPNTTPDVLRALCKYCSKEYICNSKNGTTSMFSHVKEKCPSRANPYTHKRFVEVSSELGQSTLYDQAKLFPTSSEGSKGGVKPMSFTQDTARGYLTQMIVLDELPFDFVEGEGFKRYSYYLQPKFVLPSRFTVKKDVMELYQAERRKLKKLLINERLCLTTDAWTSIQNLSYMCLTAHWIDSDWKYHKRILNFCLLPNHKGEAIGKAIEACLADWGIEKIMTITVDNASANNTAIKHLKKKNTGFLWKDNISDHAYLHMRCSAHIVNLIVKAGMNKMHDSIVRIRNAVRYVRSSPSRTLSFDSCVKATNINHKNKLVLDVETRWNSTYLMLASAEKYEIAFERLSEDDGKYSQHFGGELEDDEIDDEDDGSTTIGKSKGLKLGSPQDLDWQNSRVFIKFLKLFYEMTLKFSGSHFITSNEFLHEIIHLHRMLKKLSQNCTPLLTSMAHAMNLKFKKYWGDFDGINGLLYVAVLLDPRYKISYIKYSFGVIYGEVMGSQYAQKVEGILHSLYEQYSRRHAIKETSSDVGSSSSKSSFVGEKGDTIDSNDDDNDVRSNWERLVFQEHNSDGNNEVVRYLGEPVEPSKADHFDILNWWKTNASKYPVISQIARHVLAIPVSTVASESAFSTGGRILDPYRSSLAPTTVEALICTQNWLRSTPSLYGLKEIGFMIDDVEYVSGTPPPSDTQHSSNSLC